MKKKIGILTFSLADNAGAMVQSFGLYSYFEKSGFDVELIKYYSPFVSKRLYPNFSLRNILHFKQYIFSKKEHKLFTKFRKELTYSKIIKIGCLNKLDNEFNYVFIGSDQVLNLPLTNYDFGFLNINKIKCDGVFGYGLSLGAYLPQNNFEITNVNNLLAEFDKVSFREDIRNSLPMFASERNVCDPTILAGREFWNEYLCKNKKDFNEKFIFLYYANEQLLSEAIKYAKEKGLKIYYNYNLTTIPKNKMFKHVCADPKNFVNLISNAEYVFTTSFHCLVFSLFYKKPIFIPIKKEDSRFIRMQQIIDKYSINKISDKDAIGKLNIDYDSVFKKMDEEKKNAENYIKDCVNE